MNYEEFIERKLNIGTEHGFAPLYIPEYLFDFQKYLLEWAVKKGRAAIYADCGLGKTPMQLCWAENIVRKTNKNVLILTPLAVSTQTVKEAEKFGIEAMRSRDGKIQKKITVTNYEQLDKFNSRDFSGVVCDESSILKHYTGATQKKVTRFLSKVPYRLLCTATAAPNDWIELGTSSEALGELTHSEMLNRFFRYCDDKTQKKEERLQTFANKAHNYYQKLAFRVSQSIGQWRLKNHAIVSFWQWVASWAIACRMPSDIGFKDDKFILPKLEEKYKYVIPKSPPDGCLFNMPAFGLAEEREERKRTIAERCETVATLADDSPVVIWCHYNAEGDLLEKLISDSKQISGRTPDEEKEEIYNAFTVGDLKKIIIKPKIGAWGLNWQHCSNVITFATHSYEQYYQAIRRCWRFGQTKNVTINIIATEGEKRVIENMQRKAHQAKQMFNMLVQEMNNSKKITLKNDYTKKEEIPTWL